MKPMIEVENLTKRYGPVLAVDNVSFAVDEGKVIGFLGPNGAGKSTTLKILTCYLAATSGTARVAGFSVFRDSMEVRRRIGYLPENVPLYPEMRVREYLRFRARLRGVPANRRKVVVAQAAERCWLTQPMDVMRRRIDQLSKGYRQRVGLADAILHSPQVLVLDEPTIGLDPTQIRETRHLIHDLGREHTVIFSSHILGEVEQVSQEVIIIAGGKLVAQGRPADLRQQVSGGLRLSVEMRGGDRSAMASELKKAPGVRDVEVLGDGEWVQMRVTPATGHDPRPEIFKTVAARGWQLREIRREMASLEDFFIQKTAATAKSKD
ncbi:MAG: Vitamin B12 import ATP-binding protein BtuD [Phycisphaerae bacterium]|nr:Vitamin B12 import ATP-binding protein BtuD [Phycisphaerae bacterium]